MRRHTRTQETTRQRDSYAVSSARREAETLLRSMPRSLLAWHQQPARECRKRHQLKSDGKRFHVAAGRRRPDFGREPYQHDSQQPSGRSPLNDDASHAVPAPPAARQADPEASSSRSRPEDRQRPRHEREENRTVERKMIDRGRREPGRRRHAAALDLQRPRDGRVKLCVRPGRRRPPARDVEACEDQARRHGQCRGTDARRES